MTVKQLKAECKRKGIKGYSKLKKAQLEKKCLQNMKRKPEQKGGKLSIKDLKKFSKIIELEEYEADAEDDYGLELYDELVEQGKAFDMCRGKISKRYIYTTFNNTNADGFIASIKGEIVGFIIYYKKKDHLYLDLVCSGKNEKTKGIPLGQVMIIKMEEYAKKKKISTIKADAVKPALSFYKSIGWKVTGKVSNDKYPIEKSLKNENKIKKPIKKPTKKPTKKIQKKKGFFAKLFNIS